MFEMRKIYLTKSTKKVQIRDKIRMEGMMFFWVTKLSWGFPNFNGVCPWGLI